MAVLAANSFLAEPSIPADLRGRRPAGGHVVAAAPVPRGAGAAHGPPRPDHRRQRAVQLRHAGGRAARPGDRRRAHRLGGDRLVLRGRRRRPSPSRARCTPRCGPTPTGARPRPRACAGSPRGGATRSAGATCSAPTSSTSPPCCSRCRWCSSRPWRPRSSSAPSCWGCSTPPRRSAPCVATALSGWTSHVHHHGRAIVIAAAAYGACIALAGLAPSFGGRAGLLRDGRGGRHDLGRLPRDGVEPDHPRAHARPAGRHRDAVLLGRPAGRPGPRGLRGRRLVGARLDRLAAASRASAACCSPPRCCGTSGPTTTAPTSTPSPSGSGGVPRPE